MNAPLKVPYTGVLGHVLQQCRRAAGFSQASMAERVGLTQSTWAKIEKGLVPINAVQLVLFSEATERDCSVLFQQVESAVAAFQDSGHEVVLEKLPAKVSDASSNFILGAALAGLLTTVLLSRDS